MTSPRQALITKINVARKELRMQEDDYRAVLERLTGQSSLRALDVADLEVVVGELRRLGWEERAEYRRKKSSQTHVRMIYGLWLELGDLNALKDPSKAALRAFVKRQTGISAPEFLRNFKESTPVIEALKKMVQRAKKAA